MFLVFRNSFKKGVPVFLVLVHTVAAAVELDLADTVVVVATFSVLTADIVCCCCCCFRCFRCRCRPPPNYLRGPAPSNQYKNQYHPGASR